MFIVPPNNFNGSPMWNAYPMFSEPPMMPLPNSDVNDDHLRQRPIPQAPPINQDFQIAPDSPIVNNPLYNQGWLTTQIGKYVRIAFLLGTNLFQDRTGTIQEVGISFIILKETSTNDLIMCDMYSIKFVTVYNNQDLKCQK
ncbi:hypothetical protein [Clostridium sp.]|uniref:hypothetical protein n=1 Tax=Clostridium sp. TaxID=1506 RepID=UPI003D6D9E10